MTKTISIVLILAYLQTASSIHMSASGPKNLFKKMEKFELKKPPPRVSDPKNLTLRQWIKKTGCLNVASQPLMNTQFAQLGALDALRDEGLFHKVTGLAGVSSGAFVMALAATKNFAESSKKFRELWPGWFNMIPGATKMQDPQWSEAYNNLVLSKVLPKTFEELKVPLGIVATKYENDKAAAMIDNEHAHPMVVSDGDLPGAVIVSSSAMIGPGCPKCKSGFQAKNFKGEWPVADGFLKDEYGTLGLAALKPCGNLLHFQPENYPEQLAASTPNKFVDLAPDNVVSLSLDIPSSAIMSMNWDNHLAKIDKFRKKWFGAQGNVSLPKKVGNQDEAWEKLMYQSSYDHMKERLDQPMTVDPKADEAHYLVSLSTKEHWDTFRSGWEKWWDDTFDKQHTTYWQKTAERRNKMVGDRNEKIHKGELSYRKCGNGLGAPKCK